MAKKISSLSVIMGATVKPFVSAFSGAQSSVAGLTSSLRGAAGSVLKFTGLGGALTAALGGAGLTALVSQQMAAIGATTKLAMRMGITTEAMSGFQHAAYM